MIRTLAGSVGPAELAPGLTMRLQPSDLLVVVKAGDDSVHLGFHMSPGVGTVIDWLSGQDGPVRGWSRARETWNFPWGRAC
jgi:LPPG:FO 2-phospho-L-lactate transferase